MSNLFEQAARSKFRFPSVKGELTVEHLWDLPLTSKSGVDLDSVAKAVNALVKAGAEESFVNPKSNPAADLAISKLEVVKHIIAVKMAEAEKAKQAAGRAAERQRLLEILDKKENSELEGLTKEQIVAKLAELG